MKPILLLPVLAWILAFFLPDPSLIRRRYPGLRTVVLSFLWPLLLLLVRILLNRPVVPAEEALDAGAAVLAMILMPVPYDGRFRILPLEWAVLAVPALSLAGCPPVWVASLLLALSLVFRSVVAVRTKRNLRTLYRAHRFRHYLYAFQQSSLWMAWAFLLVLSFCGTVPSLVSLLGFEAFYALLIARYSFGNPLSLHPSYEEMIRSIPREDGEEGGGDEEPEKALYERCCRYMAEKKPYLVESFSISDLANAVFTNKTYLSRTINRQSGKNFRQFLNEYRVAYSKELFMKNMSLKVNDLAELSGFHTITTYTMAFKVVMDESPSAWCRRMRVKSLR